MRNRYADVVLRLAVPGTLQFAVPDHLQGLVTPGQRVRVPLRRSFEVGYVASLSEEPKVRGIKPLAGILDEEPLLLLDLLSVLLWVGEHYLAPPGLVFRSALPRGIHLEGTGKGGGRERSSPVFRLAVGPEEARNLADELQKRAPLQARLLHRAAAAPLQARGLSSSALAALRTLAARGVLREERQVHLRGLVSPQGRPTPPPVLTPPQRVVLDRILGGLSRHRGETFLLHGVTGSGKSEIYSRAVQELPPGRQAIIMVPEVSLTSHLIGHFRRRIPWPLGVWHHQLSEGERYDLWKAMRRGEIRVVIGARSAVFAPFPDLGLIVLDEEHDASYKQDEVPSYHTRDVALRRASLTGAAVILGSATPSVESYYGTEQGRFTLLTLTGRYGDLPLPRVEMIDLKDRPAPHRGEGAPPPGGGGGPGRDGPGDHSLPPRSRRPPSGSCDRETRFCFFSTAGAMRRSLTAASAAGPSSAPTARSPLSSTAKTRSFFVTTAASSPPLPRSARPAGAPAFASPARAPSGSRRKSRTCFPGGR